MFRSVDLDLCSIEVKQQIQKLIKTNEYIDRESIKFGERCIVISVSDVNNEFEVYEQSTEYMANKVSKITGWFKVFRDGFGNIYLNKDKDTSYIN